MKWRVFVLGAFFCILAFGLMFISKVSQPQDNVRAVAVTNNVLPSFDQKNGYPDTNQIFDLINKERAQKGLAPMIRDPELTKIAELRALDMAQNNYYAHKSPNGTYFDDLLEQANYELGFGCENLDLAYTVTPRIYVNDWMQSTAGHKECILDTRLTNAGYAAAKLNPAPGTDAPAYIVVAIHTQSTK